MNIGIAAVALRKRWDYLILLAAAGTVLMEFAWAERFFEPWKANTAFAVFLGFQAQFLAFFAFQRRAQPPENRTAWAAIAVGFAAILWAFCLLGYPEIGRRLWVLQWMGLGYVRLGQPAPTLSGGEAQRLKIARELRSSARSARGVLYVMDEPSVGLHVDDLARLLGILRELVDRGNTVVMVEHQLDLVARADHVIDRVLNGVLGAGDVARDVVDGVDHLADGVVGAGHVVNGVDHVLDRARKGRHDGEGRGGHEE